MVCKGQLTVHKPASAASSLSLGIPHLFQRLQRRSERDPCFCGEWSLLVCWSLKSHRDLSKLNVKVCCCFIEPGGAIKMKKEASSLHHWSMVNVVNMLFFLKEVCCKSMLLASDIRIVCIYGKPIIRQICCLAFGILDLIRSPHPS